MDIKRTLITLVLITTTWMVWMRYFGPRPQPPVQTPPAAQPSVPAAAQPSAPKQAAVGQATPVEEPATPEDEATAELDTREWHAIFRRGALEHFTLKSPQYRRKVGGKEAPIDFVGAPGALETLWAGAPGRWHVEKQTPTEVQFVSSGADRHISKRFSVGPGIHELKMEIAVTNTSARPVAGDLEVKLFGKQEGPTAKGSFFGPPAPSVWEGECLDQKIHKKSVDTLKKESTFETANDVRWTGIADRYFLFAVAPDPMAGPRKCRIELSDANAGIFRVSLTQAASVPPGQTRKYEFALFAGPKFLEELDAVRAGGQPAKLGEALDYGWWSPIAKIMLWILVAVHRGVANWGLAIIALTILARLLMYPLTQKSLRSGKEMAKLKPKLEVLQKRYKDDKQRLNMEIMSLYKTHGVNPLGGCLPMLIQIPIWMALYRTLGNAVELYRSRFLWIGDLTEADPYYITPIAAGVLMFVQQKITPMPTDNEQQKIMMYMMPLMFTFMSLWFPAGLTLYILTSTLLGMVQQWWTNRSSGEHGKVLRPARAS